MATSQASPLSCNRGMTLVEILAVIVLLSLIMAVVARGVVGKGESAKAKLNVVRMEKIKNALEQYRLEFNNYPGTLDNLIKPSSDIKKAGQLFTPFVEEKELADVWGFKYIYKTENDNRSYALSSLGSDGISGGDGAKQDVTMRP